MTIYRAFFINMYGDRFSIDYLSEVAMEKGIDDQFFMGSEYNGYITIEVGEQ